MFKANSYRWLGAAMLLALCLTCGGIQAFAQAQASTGQIAGTVRDNNGAAIANATVKAVSKRTGLEVSATTNEDGLYRFVLLPPGEYDLKAEAGGFSAGGVNGVTVGVGQTIDANITLGVGAVSAAVTVTADAIQTTVSVPDSLFNQKAIDNLPINGRRFQDFVQLTPTAIVDNATRGQISLSGQRGINSNIQIDGADYNQPFFGGIRGGERSNNGYTIPQESIQEFQVVAAGYSAEFGRSTGGVVNAVTKSGTNAFHGSAFYLHRPDQLSRSNEVLSAIARARNREIPGAPTQQQWGASLGGPIKKDKSFFFGSYEQQRIRQNRNVVFTLLNLLQGDATAFAGLSAPSRALFDQFRQQEVGYQETNDAITFLGRYDYQFGNGSRFNVRYNYSANEGKNANATGGAPDPTTNRALSNNGNEKNNTNTVAGQLSTFFTPVLSNELRVQYSREERPREANSTNPNVGSAIGNIGARNFLPTTQFDWRFQVSNNLTWVLGNHTTKFGAEVNHVFVDQVFGFNQFGTYGIGGVNTATAAGVAQVLDLLSGGATGRPFDGAPNVATLAQQIGNLKAAFSGNEFAIFAQDAWRLRPNFTLNYGLRWEAQFNPAPEANNTPLVDIIRQYRSPIGNGRGVDPTFIPDFNDQLAPRVGFAWDPKNNGKTVIRGDAGVYYARTPYLLLAGPFNNFRSPAGDLSVTLPFALPASFVSTAACPNRTACDSLYEQLGLVGFVPTLGNLRPLTLTEIGTIAQRLGLPFNSAVPNGLAPLAFANDYKNPRSFQVGAGIERELGRGLSVGADFRNVNTSRLQRNRELNLAAPSSLDAEGRPIIGLNNRPLNVFSGIAFGSFQLRESTAQARYTAATFRANLRRSWGQLSAFYTLSENFSDDDNERDAGGVTYMNTFDLTPDYNYSNLDQRHQFLFNSVFFLPYGFEVAASSRINSGRPLNAVVGSDRNGDGTNNDRPYSAFGVPFKRNAFRNRPFYNVDSRIQKRFKFGETRGLVFSAEFFNMFNFENALYAGPQATYCAPSAVGCGFSAPTNLTFRQLKDASGNYIITNTPGVPFQVQLGARFQF
ncbi:MAG TPA: carboxypeptidase regulatory-like domain-containing protein [Blastocatellia bacterium]|nr:carboxypeptidase regulatory-like domain-containing protein [Blastocatellia bacterium]HMX25455.1 carboxypeptidase regulatory-like domain-containing protein [Blastocatellia bacterium]HMZ17670.1 carboxypeptidase regulatory-like domain-containing protein [Blastocatellia bacterium]HNG28532.1 carboxypeptidase regulatory-like domain-containing protein [Blastocatellia bacterium]